MTKKHGTTAELALKVDTAVGAYMDVNIIKDLESLQISSSRDRCVWEYHHVDYMHEQQVYMYSL